MDKKALSKIPREAATADMLETAKRIGGTHIITTRMVGEILLLNFYRIAELKEGKTEAEFRTFFSHDDYITQDLGVQNVKWLTAALCNMPNIRYFESRWNSKEERYDRTINFTIRSDGELRLMSGFFRDYTGKTDLFSLWDAIYRFQQKVMGRRLEARHKKETDAIDAVMETVKEPPEEFIRWSFEEAMGFSRYLIYQEVEKGTAECECTYCGRTGRVDRRSIRLRNNEKGNCPFCNSPVTVKAKGRLPYSITDKRWTVYIDRTENGFIWRAFKVWREIVKHPYIADSGKRVSQGIREFYRGFYTFDGGYPVCKSYEYAIYKQRGGMRWCPDESKIRCGLNILYPGNLPQAWEHTPMKYSALEVMSRNRPTIPRRYENGISVYAKYPYLEWMIKMGLYKIAEKILEDTYSSRGMLDKHGKTIYQILRLDKLNTRILQEIDGSPGELELLQAAQSIGLRMKPELLREYSTEFGSNTELLRESGRKASLHKITKYIRKESENYPVGNACRGYAICTEREDPRIERLRNTAKDWLEYIGWCRKLKYDLDNMFYYMPKNFKEVHDRTAKEYQALQDKKAAAERRRREREAAKHLAETEKAMAEIFKKNEGVDAFSIKGKGLVLMVPKSAEEIKAEGAALHHCVGTYVGRVARGETNIFFVRREEFPEEPYFTMEYCNGKVVQCRGNRNCGMPPDVNGFVKAFEKKMAQGKENDKRRKA